MRLFYKKNTVNSTFSSLEQNLLLIIRDFFWLFLHIIWKNNKFSFSKYISLSLYCLFWKETQISVLWINKRTRNIENKQKKFVFECAEIAHVTCCDCCKLSPVLFVCVAINRWIGMVTGELDGVFKLFTTAELVIAAGALFNRLMIAALLFVLWFWGVPVSNYTKKFVIFVFHFLIVFWLFEMAFTSMAKLIINLNSWQNWLEI